MREPLGSDIVHEPEERPGVFLTLPNLPFELHLCIWELYCL